MTDRQRETPQVEVPIGTTPQIDYKVPAIPATLSVPATVTSKQSGEQVLAPTTTSAQNAVAVGQRRVNLIWEITQSLVASLVTVTTLYVAAQLSLRIDGQDSAFLLLSNGFFLVSGFYFGRTNHQKTGGVGGGEVGR